MSILSVLRFVAYVGVLHYRLLLASAVLLAIVTPRYFASQTAQSLSGCTYTVQPIGNFAYWGGNVTTSLTADANCPWTLSLNAGWINPANTSPLSGTSSATLSLGADIYWQTASPDSNLPRTGSVTVGGQMTRFTQGAQYPDPAYSFSDVTDDHNDVGIFNYIALMKYRHITSGCSPTQYCPNSPLTNAQIAVFLVRAVLYPVTYPYDPYNNQYDGFTYGTSPYYWDVPQDHWAFAFIQKLQELGISLTPPGGTFCPDQCSVTREQMAQMIIKGMISKGLLSAGFTYRQTPYFTDVYSGPSFPYVQKLRELGITAGVTPTTFGPTETLLRYQAAIFVVRAFFTQ